MDYGYVFLFLGNVIGFIYQWFREERHHRWQKENISSLKSEIRKSGMSCDYRKDCPSKTCPIREEEHEY